MSLGAGVGGRGGGQMLDFHNLTGFEFETQGRWKQCKQALIPDAASTFPPPHPPTHTPQSDVIYMRF